MGVKIISESDFESMIGGSEGVGAKPEIQQAVKPENKKENEKIAVQGELF